MVVSLTPVLSTAMCGGFPAGRCSNLLAKATMTRWYSSTRRRPTVAVSPAANSQELAGSTYMLKLPPPAIPLNSQQGNRLFGEALVNNTANGALQMLQVLEAQKELKSCSLATLSTTLNALQVDPQAILKGRWRWYQESMLAPTDTVETIQQYGTSFKRLAALASNNNLKVHAYQAQDTSFDEFKSLVSKVSAMPNAYVIVNYSRDVLNQVGSAHFAPLAAYHGPKDMLLVLDVAKYKYPCHWVPTSILWDAINTIVPKTGNARGYMVVSTDDDFAKYN